MEKSFETCGLDKDPVSKAWGLRIEPQMNTVCPLHTLIWVIMHANGTRCRRATSTK